MEIKYSGYVSGIAADEITKLGVSSIQNTKVVLPDDKAKNQVEIIAAMVNSGCKIL